MYKNSSFCYALIKRRFSKEVSILKGKIVILIVIIVTLLGIALAWYMLRDTIEKYDIDERTMQGSQIIQTDNTHFI